MDTIYTEVSGTTCYINGERGIVTGFMLEVGKKTGAFIKLDERPAMLYVTLGATTGERGTWREVTAAREIDRDDFDRITGLDEARRDWGWAA